MGADLEMAFSLRFFGPMLAWALASAPKEMLLREVWMSSLSESSSSSSERASEALELLSESEDEFDTSSSDPSSCDCGGRVLLVSLCKGGWKTEECVHHQIADFRHQNRAPPLRPGMALGPYRTALSRHHPHHQAVPAHGGSAYL